jgi:hypothetical protein
MVVCGGVPQNSKRGGLSRAEERGVKVRDGETAIADVAKLQLYCLDPKHPRGWFKARQFASHLGFEIHDAEVLQQKLLEAVQTSEEAVVGDRDEHGQRYQLDIEMEGPGGTATVRSNWIVRTTESHPRLLTCYVL